MELRRCSLCGFEFDASHALCTPSCPLSAGCVFVCCPNCGYREVDASRASSVRWLQRFLNNHARPGKELSER